MFILGDNQYLGVNHANPTQASNYFSTFSNDSLVVDSLKGMMDVGVTNFSFTFQDRYLKIFDDLERQNYLKDLKLYPAIPYAHHIASEINKKGLAGFGLHQVFKRSKVLQIKSLLSLTAKFRVLYQNFDDIRSMTNVQSIFLLNIFFDFCRAFDIHTQALSAVEQEWSKKPSIYTYNLGHATDGLDLSAVDLICSPMNQLGFSVYPNLGEMFQVANNLGSKYVGMSVLASGLLDDKGVAWFKENFPHASIIVGSSKLENIKGILKWGWD
ncbi:hypothetical protein [Shewanella sp.]|uniref:hypothetical protein n=1 Tax=Shewanella sp. TaxID=50422 RepID=UPI004047A07E